MTAMETQRVEFEGREVNGRELKLAGALSSLASLDDAHAIDDELVVIGVFKVDKITHELKPKRGFVRVEGAGAIELHVVTGDTDALDILGRARADREAALDALLGRERLPFDDDGLVSDAGLQRLIDGDTAEIETDEDLERRLRDAVDEDDPDSE